MLGPFATFFPLQSRLQHIYHGQPYARVEFPQYGLFEFFENSRRYSRLKVHHRCQRHRWQMEKIFKQKNFNNFVWPPLGIRVTIYINFCLQVHFKVSAA